MLSTFSYAFLCIAWLWGMLFASADLKWQMRGTKTVHAHVPTHTNDNSSLASIKWSVFHQKSKPPPSLTPFKWDSPKSKGTFISQGSMSRWQGTEGEEKKMKWILKSVHNSCCFAPALCLCCKKCFSFFYIASTLLHLQTVFTSALYAKWTKAKLCAAISKPE